MISEYMCNAMNNECIKRLGAYWKKAIWQKPNTLQSKYCRSLVQYTQNSVDPCSSPIPASFCPSTKIHPSILLRSFIF